MQVKKFEAPTIQEALETIKRELGPEAIILQTKKNRSGFGLLSKSSVEVTAAVSERSIQKKGLADKKLPPSNRVQFDKLPARKQAELYEKTMDHHLERAMMGTSDQVSLSKARASISRPAAPQAREPIYNNTTYSAAETRRAAAAVAPSGPSTKITSTRYIDIEDEEEILSKKAESRLHNEMQSLKKMFEDMKIRSDKQDAVISVAQGIQSSSVFAPAVQEAYDSLIVNGVDRRFAFNLVKQVQQAIGPKGGEDREWIMDALAGELMLSTSVMPLLSGLEPSTQAQPVMIALVGPTGVGKTTTVAKIASEAILKRNLKVGLINLDTYKVAAFDQLATYAKILGTPFRSAGTPEDLQAAIRDFSGLDLILIDTTGRSQRDPESLKAMETLLRTIPQIQTELVLSVTTRDTELYDMATRFGLFKPQGLILSKLDEATLYGAIYNISQKAKLPVTYFTTGQRVPEDIEEATRERVASLILGL